MLSNHDLYSFFGAASLLPFISIAAGLGGSIYVLTLIIYRLYFHPLAAVPGPFFARITDWWNVFSAWNDDRHIEFYKLHERYGPLVRYGPSRVSVNTIAGLHEISGVRSNVQKSQFYGVYRHYFDVPCTLSVLTNKEHTPKRKIVSQAFSETAVQAMEEHVLRNVRSFCDQLGTSDETKQGPWSNPFNIAKWTGYLTFDIMSTLCFSTSYNMLTSDKQRWITSVPKQAMQGLNVAGHMQWLVEVGLDKLIFSKLVAANAKFQTVSSTLALGRYKMQDEIKVKDAFYFLQNAQDPATGARLTNEQLVAEAGLMIGAGSDTTATAMSSTIFYLLKRPKCLAKLQQEIRTKFSDLEDIRGGSDLLSCNYLRACIDEGLRLAPGVAGILPREVLPGGLTIPSEVRPNGEKIPESFIPAGMDIGVPIWAIHHNENYFPEPFEFIPERWIPDSESPKTSVQQPEAVEIARDAFCAFSLGAWGCLGKALAYKEISITIARMIWLYDWQIAPGTTAGEGDSSKHPDTMRHRPDEYQGKDWFALVVDGPMVEFRKRSEDGIKA